MNIEFLKSLLLNPQEPRTPAQATLASWVARCNTGGAGGDNLFKHNGRLYLLSAEQHEHANGAISGRVFKVTAGGAGLFDAGAFKVRQDGSVERVPEELRDVLTAIDQGVVQAIDGAFRDILAGK